MSERHRINPLQPFLDEQGWLVLDGGLATQLEARGLDLDNDLWSADLLLRDPGAIRAVHLDNLRAGADCIVTSTYQATIPGFEKRGLSRDEALRLLRSGVEIGLRARDDFWADESVRSGRRRPLVAASIGPWGAYRADGSEYTGDYDIDAAGLLAFHRPRWEVLADSGADLLACETIPTGVESQALAQLLLETPHVDAWFSFCCRDGRHLSDGTPLVEHVEPLVELDQVIAVGINCTAPRFVPSLIAALRSVTDKPIVVYPNSGERFDAADRSWSGDSGLAAFESGAREWHSLGATLIGGCCRTGPEHVRQIRLGLARR